MDKGFFLLIAIFLAINFSIVIVSMWKVFEKANKPGWGVLIPVYNIYLLVKFSGKPTWWTISFILYGLIPIIGIIGVIGLAIPVSINIAKKFRKGTSFGLGLVFLSIIFWPILGFGNAIYSLPDDIPREDQI